ncbi:hypothetical protein [Stackebrandtia nassauensis]|uniref:Uncharacterized protein n=1 Tax=Stackebrandtia nassauensis (strain DSM 44728 / CIP 108903 / NRRL B-16338 / NBRC 102104 / LLR-40K-21) TaxID=446470 RepID=D3PWI0_STANL|nr:hypothetical protein [Stackebrandtia nassauensis]ADD43202.1 hypothetical protein Snas_3540 [Stackebrandtia nassauensis DSM 44728]
MDAAESPQSRWEQFAHLSAADGMGIIWECVVSGTKRAHRDAAIRAHPVLTAVARTCHDVSSDLGRARLMVFAADLADSASGDASVDEQADPVIVAAILEVACRHASHPRARRSAKRFLRLTRSRRSTLAAHRARPGRLSRWRRHVAAVVWRYGIARRGLVAAATAIAELPDPLRDRAAKRMLAAALSTWYRYLSRREESAP